MNLSKSIEVVAVVATPLLGPFTPTKISDNIKFQSKISKFNFF